jgi:cell division protein FtsI/penicillin-binding protein 2
VHDVVHSTFGSAHQGKGLNTNDLGFELAAKTGSADYHRTEAGDMRKHTWLAGWFPSSAPEFIVVVYCHDTSVTSSHSAVYVASQFLRRPEVQALMQSASAEGVPAEGGQR